MSTRKNKPASGMDRRDFLVTSLGLAAMSLIPAAG